MRPLKERSGWQPVLRSAHRPNPTPKPGVHQRARPPRMPPLRRARRLRSNVAPWPLSCNAQDDHPSSSCSSARTRRQFAIGRARYPRIRACFPSEAQRYRPAKALPQAPNVRFDWRTHRVRPRSCCPIHRSTQDDRSDCENGCPENRNNRSLYQPRPYARSGEAEEEIGRLRNRDELRKECS